MVPADRAPALRTLVFGCHDQGPGYPRGGALLQALHALGPVDECRVELPASGRQRLALVRSPLRWPGYALSLWRARGAALRALRARIAAFRPELVVVPYPGHATVHWARAVWRGPLLLDLFLSAYETAVEDRGLFAPASLPARFLRRLDHRAIAAADLALADTDSHARAIAGLARHDPTRLDWWPVGEARALVTSAYRPPRPDAPLEVLFFGTGIPLHGLCTLLEAVARTERIRLTLIGGSDQDRRAASLLPAGRVELGPGFVERAELDRRLAAAHLVAGIFGTSRKADVVVPFKLLHAFQAGRPVITADTTAVRELLEPGADCEVVPAGDPGRLAAALARLRCDPARLADLAAAGHAAYQRRFAPPALALRLQAVVGRLVPRAAPAPVLTAVEAGR